MSGGRAKEADPSFVGVPKRVAKKEIHQKERERTVQVALENAQKGFPGAETPMQRERGEPQDSHPHCSCTPRPLC